MFSREEFYYQGVTAGETYLNSPGVLQVNRLLNQQPGIFFTKQRHHTRYA